VWPLSQHRAYVLFLAAESQLKSPAAAFNIALRAVSAYPVFRLNDGDIPSTYVICRYRGKDEAEEIAVTDLLKRPDVREQFEVIRQGTVDLLPEDELLAKLARSIDEGKPLRIKQGFDPTSPDIHIGHAVGLRKLRQFQDLGHRVVLIVGDYTSLVGDPSGRTSTRPMITYDEIMRNAETYQEQFFRIVDKQGTEIRYNSEWFKGMEFLDIMHLASRITVARLLERDDFTKRMEAQTPISLHELFYPMMQAYDSVAIDADVELGATEQTFNLLTGRAIQEAYGKEPQIVLTLPILVGLDGKMKMSKSLGNYIGVTESPKEMYGKTMSIPDESIADYFALALGATGDRLEQIKATLSDGSSNPMRLKEQLAIELVDLYHPVGSGATAREEFARIFKKGQLPDEIPELAAADLASMELDPEKVYLVHLMTKADLTKSNGEARKLIQSGAVSINGEKIADTDFEFALDREIVLKVGKRRFLRLIP
jgi:tyrosyl-tRNA synthetase